ncbi:helix-turn-helix domain-containing protein [Paenibacillus yanchengensis]
MHISKNELQHGFRAHRHDFLEFSYVISGSGCEVINGIQHQMQPGTFTFVLPYQIHEIFTDPGQTLVLINCNFNMELLMEQNKEVSLFSLIDREQPTSHIQLQHDDHRYMLQLLENMLKEYNENNRWKTALLQARLMEVLITFDRIRQQHHDGSTNAIRQTESKSSVWPIIYYIHQNYQEPLTLTELANRFSISLSRISEIIKETTGQSFVPFLHDVRIRHACSLLASTDMSITEIALEVGYGSFQTFSRVFRDTKGIVPKDYRRQKNN